MRIKRRRRADLGPVLELDIQTRAGVERRQAKYGGETLALTEAQSEAVKREDLTIVRVMDEDRVIFTVLRDEDGNVLTRQEAI